LFYGDKKDTEFAIVIWAHLFCLCIGKIIAAEGNVCNITSSGQSKCLDGAKQKTGVFAFLS
jgi:hypothetical protein